jgi:hypothetical protein
MAKELKVVDNYIIATDLGTGNPIGEYPLTKSAYRDNPDVYIIKEAIDNGTLVISKAEVDAGDWVDGDATPFTQVTMLEFLRLYTGFKTASGGSEATVSVNLTGLSTVRVPEVTKDNFIFGQVEFFIYVEISAAAILTPTQPSTGEPVIGNLGANINNNNLGDLCYNNFGAASGYDLPFYTFDFGAPIDTVDQLWIKWWQFNNYVPNVFRIEAANVWNPVPVPGDWTTIVGGLTGTNVLGNQQEVNITNSTPYRYWRIYIEEPFPLSQIFMVCNEMEFRSGSVTYESIEDSDSVDMYFDADGVLNVQNINTTDTTLTVRYKE